MSSFLAGVRTLGSGFTTIARRPRLLLLGALPAVLSTLLLLGGVGTLLYFSGDLVTWMTPFAQDWSQALRTTLRVVLGVLVVGAAVLLASISFIAVTLFVGGPFYEYIAEEVEEELGLDTFGDGAGFVRSSLRGLADSLKLIGITVCGAVVLFAIGLVPVAGQLASPVLGALFGAWMISLEMVGLLFQRRGLGIRHRHRALRRNRPMTFGFGLPVYLLCLIPVAQLVVIPSAVVGGTLLAHRLTDEPQRVTGS